MEIGIGTETVIDTETGTETDTKTDTETETDTDTNTDTETDNETDIETDTYTETDTISYPVIRDRSNGESWQWKLKGSNGYTTIEHTLG